MSSFIPHLRRVHSAPLGGSVGHSRPASPPHPASEPDVEMTDRDTSPMNTEVFQYNKPHRDDLAHILE